MAYAVLESTTETSFSSQSTTHNVSMPSTVYADDLLIAFVNLNTTYFDDEDPPSVSGWTNLGWTWFNGSTPRGGLWVKKAAGTEGGGSVNWGTTSSCRGYAQCLRVTAWGGTLSTDVDICTDPTYGESNVIPMPEVVAGWGSDTNLFFAFAGFHGNDIVTYIPTNYSGQVSGDDSYSTPEVAGVSAYREYTAGSDDPDSHDLSAYRRYGGWTLVVKPGSAGGAPAGGISGWGILPG
jgi:hypothetical protein